MSDFLQPAQHPDADQLSAFAEHALPVHEQADVLAHLAVCPDCRTVVFLALPPQEPIADPAPVSAPALRPQPAPSRRHWLSGWNLAWPIAAAAFAVLLLTLVLHRQINAPTSTSNQIAETSPPTPPATPAMAAPNKPVPNRVLAMPQTPRQAATVTPPAQPADQAAAQPAGQATQHQTLTYQDVQDLALQSRDTTELLKVLPGVVATAQNSTSDTGRASAGMPAAAAAVQAMAANAPQPSVDTEANASATVLRGDALNELSNASQRLFSQPLPSRLSVLSIATSGTRMLALDTAHTLFLSEDSGQHWRTIRPAWQGLAAHIALVSQPTAAPALALRAASAPPLGSAYDGRAALPAPAVSAAAPPAVASATEVSSLSGMVTDPKGASISGATVNLTNVATSAFTTLETDHAGHYAANLPAGAYRIHVYAPGFATSQATTTLAAAQPSVDNFTLVVGATTETVSVTSVAGQILETEQSPPSTAMRGATGSKQQTPVFVITTDSGIRWTSSDGENWTRQ